MGIATGTDLKMALRVARRTPVLSLIATLALAVGVATATVAVTVVRALVYAEPPVPDPETLVMIRDHHRARGYDLYLDRGELARRRAATVHTLAGLAAFRESRFSVQGPGLAASQRSGAEVDGDALALVGVSPALGRSLLPEDTRPGAAPVVVLGEALWRRVWGDDPRALGRSLLIDGVPRSVVGVMPRDFAFPVAAELWLPMPAIPPTGVAAEPPVRAFGRLRPRVSAHAATAAVAAAAWRAAPPPGASRDEVVTRVLPFPRGFLPPTATAAGAGVIAALLLLLLVSAVNVGTLLLARGASRRSELALRAALGAGRGRLVGQLLVESLTYGTCGALLAWASAAAVLDLLAARLELPFWATLEVEPVVLAFLLAAALLAGLAAGLPPAWRATRGDLGAAMRSRGVAGGRLGFGAAATGLVVVEVAAAVGLLAPAAALGRLALGWGVTARSLPGDEVLVAQLYFGQPPAPASARDWDTFEARSEEARRRLGERLRALPGVRELAFASHFPGNDYELVPAQFEVERAGQAPAGRRARVVEVTPGFFATVGSRILAGRDLRREDVAAGAPVALVNEALARTLGPRPLGQRLRVVAPSDHAREPWREVVGVVPDLGLAPGEGATPSATAGAGVYLPLASTTVVRVALRVAGQPAALVPALHREAAAVQPAADVQWATTLAAQVAEPVQVLRGLGAACLMLGAVALLLSMAGIYALVAFVVGQRQREIALRLALGGARGAVLWPVLRRAGGQLLAGALAGGVIAAGALSVLGRLPIVTGGIRLDGLIAAAALLVVAAGLACARPLRRALATAPMAVLRGE